MSQFPIIIPYSFGYDGPNALPLTFPVNFGIQFADTELSVTVTPTANLNYASANGIAALSVTPTSTASAYRTALGDVSVPVTATAAAAMYWTMNVHVDVPITADGTVAGALSAVGGAATEATAGTPVNLVLLANANSTATTVTVGFTQGAWNAAVGDNVTTATASFTAGLTLAASGNVNLDGEARFLANEQELALGNAVTGIAVGIGAGAVLSAVADTNTVGSAGFTAGEFNAAAGFGSLGVAAGFTAAVTAAFSGNAALAGTVASSGVALRTCYGAATLTAAPATTAASNVDWNGNALRSITATGGSDFNAGFRSWAECYGTAHTSGDIRRTQYAALNKPEPPVLPFVLPLTFGGIFVGETSVTTTASAVLTRSLDANVDVTAFPTPELNLSGLADAALQTNVNADQVLNLHGYGSATQTATATVNALINAALIGNSSLRGVIFIEGAEDELALGNANVAVLVALPATAKLTGFMAASRAETVGFGNPVLSYPISSVPLVVTPITSGVAGVNHPASAELVIVPVTVPGELTANFAANAKTVGTVSTSEAMWVGYKIAAQLGITSQRTIDAIVGLIKAGLVVTATGTVDATLQPLVNSQVTGWWHFPE